MKRLKKQFGAEFAEALGKCPTLVADLQEIRRAGVKIRKIGGHCQAYSIHDKLTIYIGSACELTYQLISLAHEKVHVLTNPTRPPIPGKTSRQDFINSCLEAETDCIEHEVIVVGELIAAGYKIDDHSMSWYRLYKRSGRAGIRKAIEQATTSNTGEKYPEYYGGWYDEAIKPKDRVPFHELHGKTGHVKITLHPHPPSVVAPRLKVGKGQRDLCPRFSRTCETPVRIVLPTIDPANPKR